MAVCLPGQESNNVGMGFNKPVHKKHLNIFIILKLGSKIITHYLNMRGGLLDRRRQNRVYSLNPSVQIGFKYHLLKIFLIEICLYMQMKTYMG